MNRVEGAYCPYKCTISTGKKQAVWLDFLTVAAFIIISSVTPARSDAQTQTTNRQTVSQGMEQTGAMLDKFSAKCERRTKRAEKRFARYEKKFKVQSLKFKVQDSLNIESLNQESRKGLGKEPLLDSLRLAEGFRQYVATIPPASHPSPLTNNTIDRAQQQLDITQRTKDELQQRKEYWKAQAKEHPEYGKWLSKMEKERYYYTAQINEYRKVLRDPATLDDQLMNALRSDPRFSDFVATLPAKPQDPAKMQPRQLVQQMMQSQAAAIDPDPTQLIKDAKKKGNDLLGDLSDKATSMGNLDNATQVPKFTPNPYKTKSFWERIDVGFNLQFDNRTRFYPASGVAGAQASFNFNPKLSMGVLANYRFGMGDIKHIRFSHAGAGYGAFVNYKVWKGLGVQAGYERNWRAEMEMSETRYAAGWNSSTLAGLTWEYGIGKNLKGSVGVFFDALYQQHTPETNAVLWRMGWTF